MNSGCPVTINGWAGVIVLSLALQLSLPVNAQVPDPQGAQSNSLAPIKVVAQAAPDPIAELFPGAVGLPETSPQPVTASKQPTYESWDVLRQYPRYEALPAPSVPEPKASESKNETKEKPDVQ